MPVFPFKNMHLILLGVYFAARVYLDILKTQFNSVFLNRETESFMFIAIIYMLGIFYNCISLIYSFLFLYLLFYFISLAMWFILRFYSYFPVV